MTLALSEVSGEISHEKHVSPVNCLQPGDWPVTAISRSCPTRPEEQPGKGLPVVAVIVSRSQKQLIPMAPHDHISPEGT